jgi:hypothetical protein
MLNELPPLLRIHKREETMPRLPRRRQSPIEIISRIKNCEKMVYSNVKYCLYCDSFPEHQAVLTQLSSLICAIVLKVKGSRIYAVLYLRKA